MPSTTLSLDQGGVVLVPFPFTNQAGIKVRPAVVASTDRFHAQRLDVVLLAITGQVGAPVRLGDADIIDWQQAGLLKASRFKPIIFTTEKARIHRVLGSLSQRDHQRLLGVLTTMFR